MLSLVSATTRIAPVRNISPPTNYGKVYRNTAIHISPDAAGIYKEIDHEPIFVNIERIENSKATR